MTRRKNGTPASGRSRLGGFLSRLSGAPARVDRKRRRTCGQATDEVFSFANLLEGRGPTAEEWRAAQAELRRVAESRE